MKIIKNIIIISCLVILLILISGLGVTWYWVQGFFKSINTAVNSSGSQNSEIFGLSANELAAEDVAGADIPDVKRYPYLVRTAYLQKATGVTEIQYQTHQGANVILGYYQKEFLKAGWKLVSQDTSSQSFALGKKTMDIKVASQSGITTLTATF